MLAATTALAAAILAGAQPAAAEPIRRCAEVTIPVGFDAVVPAAVHATYCTPATGPVRAVQVLVHGATYDRHYWDQAFDQAAAANAAGYATVAIDTVGHGESTHLPSALITASAQATPSTR